LTLDQSDRNISISRFCAPGGIKEVVPQTADTLRESLGVHLSSLVGSDSRASVWSSYLGGDYY